MAAFPTLKPQFLQLRWSPGDLERSLYEGQHHDQDPSDILNIQDRRRDQRRCFSWGVRRWIILFLFMIYDVWICNLDSFATVGELLSAFLAHLTLRHRWQGWSITEANQQQQKCSFYGASWHLLQELFHGGEMDEKGPESESYFSFIWRFHLSPAARRGTCGILDQFHFTFWAHQFVDGHVYVVLVTVCLNECCCLIAGKMSFLDR